VLVLCVQSLRDDSRRCWCCASGVCATIHQQHFAVMDVARLFTNNIGAVAPESFVSIHSGNRAIVKDVWTEVYTNKLGICSDSSRIRISCSYRQTSAKCRPSKKAIPSNHTDTFFIKRLSTPESAYLRLIRRYSPFATNSIQVGEDDLENPKRNYL
jgi:hypothetical protein